MVAGNNVADLVRDHAGELVLVLRDAEDARVNAAFSAGQGERIGVVVDEHRAFPTAAAPLGRQLADDGIGYAGNVIALGGIAGLRLLRLELGEGLRAELVELLLGDGAYVLLASGR